MLHCQKCEDQKYLWRSWASSEISKSIIKRDCFKVAFLTRAIWNLEKWKRKKLKNGISTNRYSQTKFFQKHNLLLADQILLTSYIFIKPNVWYLWSLETLAIKRFFFSIHQKFYRKISIFYETFLLIVGWWFVPNYIPIMPALYLDVSC